MNPANATRMSGPDFLYFYSLWLLAGAIFAWLFRFLLTYPWQTDGGRASERLSSDEIACLSYGTKGLADSALAGLVNAGAMSVEARSIRRQRPLLGKATAVHAIIEAAVDFNSVSVSDVRKAVENSARGNQLIENLRERGLLMPLGRGMLAKWFPFWLSAIGLTVGIERAVSGAKLGNPIGFLILLILLQIVLIPVFLLTAPLRTKLGDQVFKEYKTSYASFDKLSAQSLERMTPRDVQIAVALFGAHAMVGPLEPLSRLTGHASPVQWNVDGSGSGCGSSCGSSCGGGGCGGGGCGG